MRNPATTQDIAQAERALGALPSSLRALMQRTDGCDDTPSGLVLYATSEIAERQQVYEVERYLPTHIAIGDDGGGRVIVLERDSQRVSLIDAGALGSSSGQHVTDDLLAWVDEGLPLPGSPRPSDVPDYVDVYLERAPAGGARDLVAIRRELGLELGTAELKSASERAPARIMRRVPYGKYAVLCRRLNETCSCLTLRAVDDPAQPVPIPPLPARAKVL